MKHGKRPTLRQKKTIRNLKSGCFKLIPGHWLVVKDSPGLFVIVNRTSGKVKRWKKEGDDPTKWKPISNSSLEKVV
jgi:hypothetical protein